MDKTSLNYLKVHEHRGKKKRKQEKKITLTFLGLDCLWSAMLCAKLEPRGNLKPSYRNFIMEMPSNSSVQQGKWHSYNMLKKNMEIL